MKFPAVALLTFAAAMAVASVMMVRAMDGGPRGFYTRVSREDVLARKSLELEQYPEGYYAFNVAPNKVPPKVRKPPYAKSGRPCPGVMGVPNPQGLENLCGNLNTGFLPPNPMGHTFEDDSPYPFELIRNKTLEFFSKALPILKEDETLPKVDIYGQFSKNNELQYQLRRKRSTEEKPENEKTVAAEELPVAEEMKPEEKSAVMKEEPVEENDKTEEPSSTTSTADTSTTEETTTDDSTTEDSTSSNDEEDKSARQGRALCDSDSGNFLCKMYKSVRGSDNKSNNRRNQQQQGGGNNNRQWRERSADDDDFPEGGRGNNPGNRFNGVQQPYAAGPPAAQQQDGPATPCPTTVEYVTPIFARNYQGVWRYIVQIPYEGYFTQTVEITKCMNKKCAMIDGACLAAPRWVSLLVAEMFYPEGENGGAVAESSSQPLQGPVLSPQSFRGSRSLDIPAESQGTAPHQVVDEASSSHVVIADGDGDQQQAAVARRKRETEGGEYCDGYDERGCYQVRMYYDWFLASGSCKCWKQSFADYLGNKK